MKTFTVLVLCMFALCCCQDPEAEGDAGSGGDKKGGKPRGPHHEAWAKIAKVCGEKVKVTDEDKKCLQEMWWKGKCSNEASEEAKCYMKCALIEQQKMKEDGTPTLEGLQQNITLAAQKIGECNQIKPDTSCASGYQVASCLAEARRMVKGF